jgi:hypothetical protein
MGLPGWEIGVIVGCVVLSVILIAVVVRYLCKGRVDESGERRALLGDRNSSTAAALRFDSHIAADPPTVQTGEAGGLDVAAARRISLWIDEVEKARRTDGLAPLIASMVESGQLLGDTPDASGMVTPRTPNSLSPRMSGMEASLGTEGLSSTQGVYLGYSPKQL